MWHRLPQWVGTRQASETRMPRLGANTPTGYIAVRPSGAFFCILLDRRRVMNKLMIALTAGFFAMSLNGVAVAADAAKIDAKSMKATAEGDYKAAKAKIKGDAEAAEAQCKKMSGDAKTACKKDAEAKEKADKTAAKASYDKAMADAKAMKKS